MTRSVRLGQCSVSCSSAIPNSACARALRPSPTRGGHLTHWRSPAALARSAQPERDRRTCAGSAAAQPVRFQPRRCEDRGRRTLGAVCAHETSGCAWRKRGPLPLLRSNAGPWASTALAAGLPGPDLHTVTARNAAARSRQRSLARPVPADRGGTGSLGLGRNRDDPAAARRGFAGHCPHPLPRPDGRGWRGRSASGTRLGSGVPPAPSRLRRHCFSIAFPHRRQSCPVPRTDRRSATLNGPAARVEQFG